jgi:prepilin-type N-terminal cleavage/methylation domain-containing protein
MGLVHRQRGFTLTEVLVTTVVIGVLAATMLPALMRQTNAADPARLASELGSLKTGIEVFGQNVRPLFPGDLEDLVNVPTAADAHVNGVAGSYSATAIAKWKGPYVAQTLAAAGIMAVGAPSTLRAGANGFFTGDVQICDVANTAAICPVASGTSTDFVTVEMTGLSATEIAELDTMIDGTPGDADMTGLLRGNASGTAVFFAVPYTP